MSTCGPEGHEGIRHEGGERGMAPDQLGQHRVHPIWPYPLKTTLTLPVSLWPVNLYSFSFWYVLGKEVQGRETMI